VPRIRSPASQRGRRVGQVGARHHQQSAGDGQRVDRGQVLGRLRHPPPVGGDHEHHRGHRADPGEHVRDEPLVPGYVHERQPLARGQGQPGEPQVDGQPPAPLGFPPVRFHPGQRADQGGLAVIHMTGGGNDLHR